MRTDADRYFELIIEYLKSDLNLFCDCDDLIIEEISEGNINRIFRVSDESKNQSVILKRAEPEANISKDIIIDTLRGKKESDILMFYNRLISGISPSVIGYNKELRTIVMSDMKDFTVLQDCFSDVTGFSFLPEQLSVFLSDLLFYTSDFYLDSKSKKNYQKKYINPDMCGITEKLVFSEPYDAEMIICTDANRDYMIRNICENIMLKKEVAELKYKFMTEAQSLIHGDLHFGSIFVNDKKIMIFDPEFSFYGPMGYDIGNIIAHFIIEYIIADFELKQILKDYLLKTVKLTFEKLLKHIESESTDAAFGCFDFAEKKFSGILQDSLGYAGTECIRRITGIAKLKKIEFADRSVKSDFEKMILELGVTLVQKRKKVKSYTDFKKMIDELL